MTKESKEQLEQLILEFAALKESRGKVGENWTYWHNECTRCWGEIIALLDREVEQARGWSDRGNCFFQAWF